MKLPFFARSRVVFIPEHEVADSDQTAAAGMDGKVAGAAVLRKPQLASAVGKGIPLTDPYVIHRNIF